MILIYDSLNPKIRILSLSLFPSSDDFLHGWTVRVVTYEPYRTGNSWEDASAAMMGGVGMGMAAF